MIGELFVALCRVPQLKKRLWHGWYEFMARRFRASDWSFMNYGFAEEGDAAQLELEHADEPDRYSIQLYRHVAGAVDLQGRDVLEVGCGRGGGASFVMRYLKPAGMIGLDVSLSAVELCRGRYRIDGLRFESGDAEHLPFGSDSFDAVINVESSHCYPGLSSFFSEVRRVLKPGGHFLYADLHERRSLDNWRTQLRSSGLVIMRETDITPNVLAALDQDNERKLRLIERMVPSLLRPSIHNFAATRGSKVYAAFRTGALAYLSFVVRKAAKSL
jgi:ubiquinone/menaquinone biosynthesis C-methylase UbiE